ncbi:MAG: hypothetical protein N3A66_10890 [Planctomycetota bacterium]|nr:hypothetical protein [Planctomycetota bacterium]
MPQVKNAQQQSADAANAGAASVTKPADDGGLVENLQASLEKFRSELEAEIQNRFKSLDGMAAKIRKLEEKIESRPQSEDGKGKKTQAEMEYEELKRQVAEMQERLRKKMEVVRRTAIRAEIQSAGLPEASADLLTAAVLQKYGDIITVDDEDRVVVKSGDDQEPLRKFMERFLASDGARGLLPGKKTPNFGGVPKTAKPEGEAHEETQFSFDRGVPVIPASMVRRKE